MVGDAELIGLNVPNGQNSFVIHLTLPLPRKLATDAHRWLQINTDSLIEDFLSYR